MKSRVGEHSICTLGKMDWVWVVVNILLRFVFFKYIPGSQCAERFTVARLGVVTCLAVDGLNSFITADEDAEVSKVASTRVISAGFGSFLCLEVRDASFSLGGVIEATILATHPFLEHGAFWAIGALMLVVYLKASDVETCEIISGTIGTGLIGLSLLSSILHNRSHLPGHSELPPCPPVLRTNLVWLARLDELPGCTLHRIAP